MITAALLGAVAGALSGLLGIGGGLLFVPALTLFIGLGQVRAEATSLLAVIPVAMVGAWRQHSYGNVRWRDAAVLGALSAAGAVGGVAVANAIDERTLQVAFGVLVSVIAAQLARRALGQRRERLASSSE
ncbi:MAG: TSUP family transporter [Solirubrobacteraceae bacterium]